MHGDLHMSNLLVNDDLDILAVIDWKWSLAVPLQLFLPPTRLTSRLIWILPYFYIDYAEEMGEFLSVLREIEVERYSEELLSRDWDNILKDGDLLTSSALQYPANIKDVTRQYLDKSI